MQKNSPLGLIDMDTCLKVTKGHPEGKYFNFEVLTSARNFPLQTESKDEMDKWCEILSEKIDKTKVSTVAFPDSSADQAIFSSESSDDDEDKPPKRGSQAPPRVAEPPPNGSITVEDFIPPSFRTQTAPAPVAATSEG